MCCLVWCVSGVCVWALHVLLASISPVSTHHCPPPASWRMSSGAATRTGTCRRVPKCGPPSWPPGRSQPHPSRCSRLQGWWQWALLSEGIWESPISPLCVFPSAPCAQPPECPLSPPTSQVTPHDAALSTVMPLRGAGKVTPYDGTRVGKAAAAVAAAAATEQPERRRVPTTG